MTPEQFKQALAEQGIFLTDQQVKQFAIYYEQLVEWNEKINLTAITARDDVYLKHFYDSIMLSFVTDFSIEDLTICDVGAGAGFPSIPLKIVFPHLKVTIVDSLNKRINFLNQLCEALELKDMALYHERAEIFGQQKAFRGQFDIVSARAVARLNVLCELCLPLVKKDGAFLAMKASQSEVELAEAQSAIALLGGKVIDTVKQTLPKTLDTRDIIWIKKAKETPNKFPRKPGMPNKKPLI